MALAIRQLCSFGDRGESRIEVEYDDVTLQLGIFRCVNNSPFRIWTQVIRRSDGAHVEHIFESNRTTEIDLTPFAVVMHADVHGHWLGVTFGFSYPWLG